jgi:hypothetical protein
MNPFAHSEDQFGHLQLSDNDAALHVFLAGWNSAMMEMMQRVNKMPFGDDTRASFAVYFQSQMVNVDAIEKPAQQAPAPGYCKQCKQYTIEEPLPAQQEPVAWLDEYGNAFPLAAKQYSVVGKHWKPLYTSPPAQRKPLDLSSAIQYADARWSGVDVQIEWCRHFADALAEQPAQQEIDWKDQYEKQKRRADMWVAKYEALAHWKRLAP